MGHASSLFAAFGGIWLLTRLDKNRYLGVGLLLVAWTLALLLIAFTSHAANLSGTCGHTMHVYAGVRLPPSA